MHHQRSRRSVYTTEHPSSLLSTANDTAEETRLRSLFEQASAGLACMDGKGYLLEVNQKFCEILGYECEELLQQGFLDITHFADVQANLAYLRSTLATHTMGDYAREMQYIRKDGNAVTVNLLLSPVYLKNSALDCFVCTIEDISQRRQLEELRQVNVRLEQVNKMQGDFIAIVSHEFRTTLTGIQGFSELLRDEDFNIMEVKEYANDINIDALRLNRMISELLDLERMKSGQVGLSLSKVDINMLLEEVAERMVLVAPDHMLHLDIDASLLAFEGDYDKLMQLVTNLVSHAAKYSPAHSEIFLKSWSEGNTIHIIVQDQASGIPQDALEVIFAPYSRIAAPKLRYIQGAGLGLPIAQQIVQMHGGHISIESAQGHGSVFHVFLPIIRDSKVI
jgi:PAS domain S-box-containing protein